MDDWLIWTAVVPLLVTAAAATLALAYRNWRGTPPPPRAAVTGERPDGRRFAGDAAWCATALVLGVLLVVLLV